ncbi:Rhomboid family protein [Catenulispora acidiphila DSM 44928]|uniref:Rhomboid family protein n=1 Tax=Catenulispora acidiphila (strain DSM 44928 / JCM 14897 / NBRC 102108 / NRRL B-24433 / ID139908) TaxID=479433 RepID=C7PZ01_CATAD|nr:rhomboid family intramembrane serine protease [Catenulispora acidiphila]ACU69557.1 Rhomboid family protein [Catenulispora acidiphila DSM 44928]
MTVPDATVPVTTCFRHNGRESHIRCTRCDRYICPDCMRSASVGFQCPDCVRDGNKDVRQARTVFGSLATGGTRPVVTIALIMLNFAVYAAELLKNSVVDQLGMLSDAMRGPHDGVYLTMASPPPGYHPIGVAHGQWYRMITSAFVHILPNQPPLGPMHILFNMLSLWMFGVVVEQQIGRVRYLAAYLLSAVGGSVFCYYLTAPYTQSIGASGAVFGLIGLYFVLSRKLHFDPLGGQRQLVMAVVWLVLASRFTSWQGHLGGLLTGAVIGLVYVYAPRGGRQVAIQAAGLVAILAVLVGATVVRTSVLHSDVRAAGAVGGWSSLGTGSGHSTKGGVGDGRGVDLARDRAAEGMAGLASGH